MLRKLITAALACFTMSAFAATDVNKAGQAELEAVRGVGPSLASKILDARKSGTFKNWPDLVERVRGVGPASAARLSAAGLTVDGAAYDGTAPKKAEKQTSSKAKTSDQADKPAKAEATRKTS